MASTIWEFFGYSHDDDSEAALEAVRKKRCPILSEKCEKSFNDGRVSGVCALKPMTSGPVVCCPIRLYADKYSVLHDVASRAFPGDFPLVPGKEAVASARSNKKPCIAVFGKRWGGELRLPQKMGRGGYFVDWVLALIDASGSLVEFVAVEVQTIDSTGSYRNGFEALRKNRQLVNTTAGLNWENVSKRILPQLIYKGQVLQREALCRKGLFFVCPHPVYERIAGRLGGDEQLVRYALQPASVTFLTYDYDTARTVPGKMASLRVINDRSTTVYKVQEAFNNVTLPVENVYQSAILKALGEGSP